MTTGIMLFTDDNRVATFLRDPTEEEQDEAVEPEDEEHKMGTGEAPPPDKATMQQSEFKEKVYVLTVLAPPQRAWATWNKELEASLLEEMSAPLKFSLKGVRYETDPAFLEIRSVPYRLDRYAPEGGGRDLGWCLDMQVTLREGKNQQIRRIAKRSKLIVVGLHRETFAHILHVESVSNPGDMRHLTQGEVTRLREAAAGAVVRTPPTGAEVWPAEATY